MNFTCADFQMIDKRKNLMSVNRHIITLNEILYSPTGSVNILRIVG